MSTWRAIARGVIEHEVAEAKRAGVSGRAEIIKRVDDAYPFGEREHYPYKVWLEERKTAIALLDGWRPPARTRRFTGSLVPLRPVPELEAWLSRRAR